jgi:hypothetical protein
VRADATQTVQAQKKLVAAFKIRVEQLSATLFDQILPQYAGRSRELAAMRPPQLDRFSELLREATATITVSLSRCSVGVGPLATTVFVAFFGQTFSGRGWVSRIFFGKSDVETLQEVDGGLTQCLGDMIASMQAGVMAVQVNMYEEAAKANAEVLSQIKELGNKVSSVERFAPVSTREEVSRETSV